MVAWTGAARRRPPSGCGVRRRGKLDGDGIAVNHVLQHDIAYGNGHHGFMYNRNSGKMTISNNVSV